MTSEEVKKRLKYRFQAAWMNDPTLNSWLCEVPDDNTVFSCSICKQTFKCRSSNVKRHLESTRHQFLSSNPNLVDSISAERRKRTFTSEWFNIDRFKPWLCEVDGDPTSCYCSLCQVKLSPRMYTLNRHADSKSHLENCAKNGIEVRKSNHFSTQTEESAMSLNEQRQMEELRYAALLATLDVPFEVAGRILRYFQSVPKQILDSMDIE